MLTCGKVRKIKGKRYSTEEKALQITCAHIITHMCYSARSKPWKQKTQGGDSNTTRHQPQHCGPSVSAKDKKRVYTYSNQPNIKTKNERNAVEA